MSKLRATRAQVIAAAIIVVLAVVLGGVGLYGMNARGSENGAQVLENMRLQAILNTAGSGAVDAYVAAAKSEASTKARESGGGMSAVREAAAKAEEEARAVPANDELAAIMARSARRDAATGSTSQLRRFTLPDSAPIF